MEEDELDTDPVSRADWFMKCAREEIRCGNSHVADELLRAALSLYRQCEFEGKEVHTFFFFSNKMVLFL